MKQKTLIINADDCNLTSQVTEAILKAHENGIVTSTTFLVNPPVSEITEEFKAQLQKFVKAFKRLPTHVDVHHHMHDFRPFLEALAVIARKHDLPIRWTRLLTEPEVRSAHKNLKTTDHFYGNIDPHTFWTEEVLRHLLFTLPEGTSEIMCHPGWVDDELCAISSLTIPREREYQLFSLKELRRYVDHLGIKLMHFGCLR